MRSQPLAFTWRRHRLESLNCLPDAKGDVTVLHKEDTLGVDTLHLDVARSAGRHGLCGLLDLGRRLCEPPFGAVEYIGDFTTNAAGIGSLKVDAIMAEAFVSTLVSGTRGPADLDHLVFWFADPDRLKSRLQLDGRYPLRRRWARRTRGDVLAREADGA